MSAKSLMPPQKKLTLLNQVVEAALENFNDPLWLGQNSPLAKPYFLHERLRYFNETSASRRGELLQTLFLEAHATMDKSPDKDIWRVINIYLDQQQLLPIKKKLELLAKDKANPAYIATRTFYNKRLDAIQQLGEIILKLIKPAWRLETPKRSSYLIGREAQIALCQPVLEQQQTIGLSGLSGLGKTALGRHLAGDNFFWFTLRPGLNDQLYSIFFELAHFLKLKLSSGSVLFNELSTLSPDNKLTFDYSAMLGYLRNDIANLLRPRPVFCFDEVDLPETTSADDIFHFLAKDFITLNVPTIFMGQQVPFSTHLPLELNSLTLTETQSLLDYADLPPLDAPTLAQLYQLTQGNPLWLELFITLFKLGDKNILSEWEQQPQISYLLDRLLQRLHREELATLCELVVFDRAAPQDIWSDKIITSLVNRRLVQLDNAGGVQVTASLRQLIYQHLPKGDIRLYHDKAAGVWGTRGQYTAMLYHAVQSNTTFLNSSIWLWHQYQQLEIEQGQAANALRVLESLDSDQLESDTQAILSNLLAELCKLLGQYDKAKPITLAPLRRHPYLKAHLERIKADIAELQSDYQIAKESYQASLQTLERLSYDKVIVLRGLRWVERKQQNHAKSWEYAKRAHFEVEKMYGSHYMDNDYPKALHHFNQALASSKELHYEEGEAKIHDCLGITLTDLSQFTLAEDHLNQALKIYQRIGRKTLIAGIHINFSYLYGTTQNWPKLIEHATQALMLSKELDEIRGIIVSTQNIAEAHFHLGNLHEAEKYAHEVYQTEDSEAMPHCTWLLGEIALQRDDLATAEKWLHMAFQIATENENILIQGYAQRSLGKVYLARQEFDKAKSALEHALTLLHDSPHELPEIEKLLQQIPQKLGA